MTFYSLEFEFFEFIDNFELFHDILTSFIGFSKT